MFRNVADSEEWENTTVTIYRIVFFSSSLKRTGLLSVRLWDQMAAQRFEIKWHSTAGRTFLSAAGGFAGPFQLTRVII